MKTEKVPGTPALKVRKKKRTIKLSFLESFTSFISGASQQFLFKNKYSSSNLTRNMCDYKFGHICPFLAELVADLLK